jgi:hypothetical protein
MIGASDNSLIDKQMSGNLSQGGDDTCIVDAARDDLFLDHALSRTDKISSGRCCRVHGRGRFTAETPSTLSLKYSFFKKYLLRALAPQQ